MSAEYCQTTDGKRLVKIRDGLWLSAPEPRIILGCLTTTENMSTEETEHYVCTVMRERSGSWTLDWYTFGGRDVVFINETELRLVDHISALCPEIVINAYD